MTVTFNGVAVSFPYSEDQNGNYGGSHIVEWRASGGPNNGPINGSVTCSGTITATFTWVTDYAGEPPPDQVVVAETTSAGWNATLKTTTVTTDAANGLGFPLVTSGTPGVSSLGSASGTRYKVQAGGATITLTSTASASLAGKGLATQPANASGTASVSYKATVFPLQLTLTGGIGKQEAKRYLIGQNCTATAVTGGLTASNFRWSISGGDPFTLWSGNSTRSRYLPYVPANETASSTSCYFAKPRPATITCTFDLVVPTGALPINGIPGVTLTKTPTIEPPAPFDFTWDTGFISITPPPPSVSAQIGFGGMFTPDFPNGNGVGIRFKGMATTPADYSALSPKNGFMFVQLVTPQRTFNSSGGPYKYNLNGVQNLDQRCPFSPAPGNTVPGTTDVYLYPANGQIYQTGDPPSQGLTAGGITMTSVDVSDAFETWLMYMPPGDSCYVPLRKIKWSWHASAINVGGGIWYMQSASDSYSASADGGDYPPFPVWTGNNDNGQFVPGS